MPLDLRKTVDKISEILPNADRQMIEEIVLRAHIRALIDREHGTGFSAQIMPTLRQGDHTVVAITYTKPDGEVRRMGTVIMPDPYIPEFLSHFGIIDQSQNVT